MSTDFKMCRGVRKSKLRDSDQPEACAVTGYLSLGRCEQ